MKRRCTVAAVFFLALPAPAWALDYENPAESPPADPPRPAVVTADRTGYIHAGTQLLLTQHFNVGYTIGYQHRIPVDGDDDALLVGGRAVLYKGSRSIFDEGNTDTSARTLAFGLGLDAGYRRNFLGATPLKAGLVVLAQAGVATGSPHLALFDAIAGPFFRAHAFEIQLAGGIGAAFTGQCTFSACYGGARTTAVGIVNAQVGYAF